MPDGALGTELIHIPGAIGVDEAGRGPLAGPVVAAAVLLPDLTPDIGLNDSKKLTPERRFELAEWIKTHALYSVQLQPPEVIDRINILRASLLAMANAVDAIDEMLGHEGGLEIPCEGLDHGEPMAGPDKQGGPRVNPVYVDGNQMPPQINPKRVHLEVKGDGRYLAIAAASILAKTERDRLMVAYALTYPEYGFERNFGYPTPDHLAALNRWGPCPIHRKTFGPVRDCLESSFAGDRAAVNLQRELFSFD